MEELRLVVEYKFKNWAKKVGLFRSIGLSRHWCKEHKSTIFLSEKNSKFRMFLMPTLLVEIKPVVWISRKLEPKMFSLEILDYQETDAKKNNNVFFSWLLVYMCYIFNPDFDGENWTGSGWKLKVWISSEIKLNGGFWKTWTVTSPMR